jgi:ABC-type Zn2+ transport system substrate-binding protein/surface adhesin
MLHRHAILHIRFYATAAAQQETSPETNEAEETDDSEAKEHEEAEPLNHEHDDDDEDDGERKHRTKTNLKWIKRCLISPTVRYSIEKAGQDSVQSSFKEQRMADDDGG